MNNRPTGEALANTEADEALGIDSSAMIRALSNGLSLETRKAVTACFMTHRHLNGMASPVPLLSSLTIWIRDWGLLEEDARAVLGTMCSPAMMREHKFGSDFMADLAAGAAEMIRRRESERKAASLRGPDISPEEQAKVQAKLAEIRNGVGTAANASPEFAPPSDEEVAWRKSQLRAIAERVGENP